MKRTLLIISAIAGLALAGCGGSSSQTQAAVDACLAHSQASRTACQCAVTHASAAGVSATTLLREMADGTAINDRLVVTAALECYGR